MRAALLHGTNDVRWGELEYPEPGPGEVVVEPAFNGVCGSDIHLVDDPEHSGFPLEYDEHGNMQPMRLGHEYAGTVRAIGAGVDTLSEGDHVAVFPMGYCGECANCERGLVAMCRRPRPSVGGVGEAVVVEARHLFRLPEGVDLLHGALVEPMAVAWHAVHLAQVDKDSTVLVLGAGPIGIGTFLALKAKGVTRVLVSEPSTERRATAKALGAETIDPDSASVPDSVEELAGGRGADAAIDAAGVAPAFSAAVDVLGPRGLAVVVAIHGRGFEFNPWSLQPLEKSVIGSLAYGTEDFAKVIDAMTEGAYPTDGWVSIRPAGEVLDVIADLKAGKGTKVLLQAQEANGNS